MSTTDQKIKQNQQQKSWRSFLNGLLKGTVVQCKYDENKHKESDASFVKKSLVTKRVENPQSFTSTLFNGFITNSNNTILLNGLANKLGSKLFKGKGEYAFAFYDMFVKNLFIVFFRYEMAYQSENKFIVFSEFIELYNSSDLLQKKCDEMSDRFTAFVVELVKKHEHGLTMTLANSFSGNGASIPLTLFMQTYNSEGVNQYKIRIEEVVLAYLLTEGVAADIWRNFITYFPIEEKNFTEWMGMEDKSVASGVSSEINAYEIPLYGMNLRYISDCVANISNKAGSKALIDAGQKSQLSRYDIENKHFNRTTQKEEMYRTYHYGGELQQLESVKEDAWKLSYIFGLINHIRKDENEGKEIEIAVKGVKTGSQLYNALVSRLESYLQFELEYNGQVGYIIKPCRFEQLLKRQACLKINGAMIPGFSDYEAGKTEYSGILVADVTSNTKNFQSYDLSILSEIIRAGQYVMQEIYKMCSDSLHELYLKHRDKFESGNFRVANEAMLSEFKVEAAKHAKTGVAMFTPKNVADLTISFLGASVKRGATQHDNQLIESKFMKYKEYVERLATEEHGRRQRELQSGGGIASGSLKQSISMLPNVPKTDSKITVSEDI